MQVDAEVSFILGRVLGECEVCGTTEGVQLECSRTAYHYEGKLDEAEDPNRQVALCRPHAEEHREHWDSMWADYYGGLI